MTTIQAAAARCARTKQRGFVIAAMVAIGGVGLGGCETTSTIFGQGTEASPQLAQPAPAVAPKVQRARIAVAPVIGAPDTVAKQLSGELTGRLEAQQLAVTKGTSDPFDYTLRGYMVAAPDKTQTKISYIWDISDPGGKRINRITGEEIVAKAGGRDPWATVSPEVIKTIADRTAASLIAAIPASAPTVAPPPVADAGAAASPQRTAAIQSPPAAVGSTTTGSILPGQVAVTVPRVVGAPGDGPQSLSAALQRELSKNGMSQAAAPSASTHRVEGRVSLGKAGKVDDGGATRDVQPIQIDWVVKNARGESLGTVSQKNEIKPGELDGPWGKTADAAAAAAAQGIVKLLQQQQQQTAAN